MGFDSLWPWRAALAALVAAAAWGTAWRLGRRPDLAVAAAGVGIALGWAVALGLVTATPRQLAERLPLLALVAALASAALLAVAAGAGPKGRGAMRRWLSSPASGWALALGAGWWMAGAPTMAADLGRAWPALLGVGLAAGLMVQRLREDGWAALAAALALAASFWAAAAPGPQLVLAAAVVAAVLGALLAVGRAGTGPGAAAAAPGIALAALAAVPVLARAAPQDWAAAASPLAVLWLGPVFAARLPWRMGLWAGWVLAGALCLAAVILLGSHLF